MAKKLQRILVVDDDPIITGIYRKKFVDNGFAVEVAADATVAVTALRAFDPDIVLLDLNMPGRGGAELLAKLRAVPRYSSLPVVIVTGEPPDSAQFKAAMAAGATGVIRKEEWGPELVLTMVKWALQQPQRKAARQQPAAVDAYVIVR
jgi:CheY-like chemotaxis protein